jgi:hypothetical protein
MRVRRKRATSTIETSTEYISPATLLAALKTITPVALTVAGSLNEVEGIPDISVITSI